MENKNAFTFTEKIKKTSLYVYENAKSVSINNQKLTDFIANMDPKYFANEEFLNYFNNHLSNIQNHNSITNEELIAYVCVVDSLNFCFWPLEKEYNQEKNNKINFEYDDYVSNLNQIYLNDKSFFTAERLKNLQLSELKEKVFSNLNFPLLEERIRSLNELGSFILSKYKGKFFEFVKDKEFDCEKVFILVIN
jgi:hypothetical protein